MSDIISTGYEGEEEENDELPLPEERAWEVTEVHVGTSEAMYVNVTMDGEVVGSMRLPNREYFYFVRARLRGEVG